MRTRTSSTNSARGSRTHPGSDGGSRRGKQAGPENGGVAGNRLSMARPIVGQRAHEVQPYGHIVKLPIALSEKACATSVDNLNQVLADTITLRDLYKKHHWQVVGHTFYQLHLLFDKHHGEQDELVDTIAERSGLSTAGLLTRLFELELAGLVGRAAGGRFVRFDRTC